MKRSTKQRDAADRYRLQDAEAPSTLLHALAARVWDGVISGAGVVHVRHLSKPPQDLTEANFKGVASAEAARLRRIARLKKDAAEAKKKGGKQAPGRGGA
jgi:hypothetical protein